MLSDNQQSLRLYYLWDNLIFESPLEAAYHTHVTLYSCASLACHPEHSEGLYPATARCSAVFSMTEHTLLLFAPLL